MKKRKKLAVLLSSILVFGFYSTVLAASPDQLNDIPQDHWAYKAVHELARVGIIDGYSDKSYQGDKPMTRYEMAQIVEKAMDNSNKANAKQKALIDKLASEFALELNNIDTRVKKVEKFTNSTVKVGFDTLMMYGVDNPPDNQPKVSGNDRTKFRFRTTFNGDLNDRTSYSARFTTAVGGAGMEYSNTSQNNTLTVDKAFFNTKKALGFDSILWGRQGLDELGGNVLHKGGSSDGITLIKNLSGVTGMKFGWYDIKSDTNDSSNSQDLKYIAMESRLSNKLTIGGLIVDNDSQTPTTWYKGSSYSYSGSSIKGLSAQYKMGAWTMLGEYDWAHLGNPVGDVNANPHGYAVQITNGKNNTYRFHPVPQTFTNINQPGDSAFTVAYHYNEAGLIPNKLGPWNGITVISPNYKVDGHTVSAQDGIKGWAVDYQYVLAKGIEADLLYQNLKFARDGAPFDQNLVFMINTRF